MRNVMVLAVVLALSIGACQEGGLQEGMQSGSDEDMGGGTRDETARPGMGTEGGREQRGVLGTHPLRPGLGEGTRPTDTLSGELQQHEGETGESGTRQ